MKPLETSELTRTQATACWVLLTANEAIAALVATLETSQDADQLSAARQDIAYQHTWSARQCVALASSFALTDAERYAYYMGLGRVHQLAHAAHAEVAP
jgi:hypothetical protein